jgi:hypothetical protein
MYDKQTTFMDGAIGTSVGTTYTDAINLGELGLDLYQTTFYAQITAAVTSAGAATVQFVLEKDTTSAFASPTEVWDSTALAKATLVDNYVIKEITANDFALHEAAGSDTWLRVKKVIGTADLTAGDAKITFNSGKMPRNIT